MPAQKKNKNINVFDALMKLTIDKFRVFEVIVLEVGTDVLLLILWEKELLFGGKFVVKSSLISCEHCSCY